MSCHASRNEHLRAMWILLVSLAGAAALTNVALAREGTTTTAERLVEAARQAEFDGNMARRFALLRRAVGIEPDYQVARSQLGQVQTDGQWIAVEEAQRRAAADPKQAVYRGLRAKHGETPQGQLALARWCRSNNLEEESRFHWASVLLVDPNHKQALRALKMHWYDGRLLAPEQIKQAKQETIGERRATRHWSAAIAEWERALAKKSGGERIEVLDEIRAVTEVEAIAAFERVTLDGTQSRKERDDTRKDLSRAFVEALGAISEHPATQSLVRHAVLSSFADVRREATERLRMRPLHDFVPLLLDGLAARIESSFHMDVDDDGSVHYSHTTYREGPFADWSHRASRSIHQRATPDRIAASLRIDDSPTTAAAADTRAAEVSAATALRSAQRYEQEAATAEREIAQANEAAAALNERIIAVLSGVTDRNLGSEPRPWWDWWQDHTEYYRTADRPVYETQDVSNEYVIIQPPQYECFARGTPVWTKTGQRPIESLELGELVLSQNVDTGELNYKPVLGRTVRPPSEILNISFGGETLRTTRGHPFWVTGVGWRMAKELEDGAIVHGLTGSARVAAVAASNQEEAYNLVVADFSTYFVGESGVLVHDNTPRRPTRATVPGLAAK